jgi:alpha-N-arabinofuranosidase
MRNDSIDRRAALGRLAVAGAAAGGLAAFPGASRRRAHAAAEMSITVLLNEPIGTIKPALYSQFSEHIGGVIYDGIWVGPDSKIPNFDGIRRTLVDHVKQLGHVGVRWPGGCFADKYHWRDGIGPRAGRPRRFGRWQEDTESNHFGTHEFLRFCRLCEVEPYFAANVGTGSPEEFQQWVEYCNAPAGSTSLADDRAANGAADPFKIRYWGVGNESWGCGGNFVPEDYCREYRRYTEWLPKYGVPLYLIAAGPNGNDVDWTRRFFARWRDGQKAAIQGWAPHYYCGTTGHALQFNQDQWYEQLHKANRMESLIKDQWAALGEVDIRHGIKLVIDEWGSWHPAGTEINKRHLFEQMGTLRDALVAALSLDTFNRHAEKVDMANVAQLVNNLHSLFLADGDKFVATPTFYVYTMYRTHHGAKAVRIVTEAPEVTFKAGGADQQIFRLAGSASINGSGAATVTLVHTHATEPAEVVVRLKGGTVGQVHHAVLTHDQLNAHNTFAEPANLVPKPSASAPRGAGEEIRCLLPAHSVNRLEIQLARSTGAASS